MNYINKKDILGKSLVILSVLTLIYYISLSDFSNLDLIFFHIDEYFTFGFIKFPINELITITSNDVHPPLYYILLKILTKLSFIANLSKYNIVFLRFFSIIPYLLILIVSTTKIKEKYGWLTAGILTFSLIAMSEFGQFYILIRMYSWAILFILIAFLSTIDIIENNSKKMWIILTLFSILGAYTHYFAAITVITLYLSLLCYFILNKRIENIKLWVISAIIGIISYIPWVFTLFNQLQRVQNNYWIESLNFSELINCLSFYAVNLDVILYIKIFCTIFLIVLFAAISKEYLKKPSNDNFISLLGMITFLGTLLIGIAVSFLFKPILIARYLIIPITTLWVAISIYISKIENKKILSVLIALILILGFINIASTDSLNSKFEKGVEINNLLENMNEKGNVTVICINKQPLILFGTYLDNCTLYSNAEDAYGVKLDKFNETSKVNYIQTDEIPDLTNRISGTIYIIKIESVETDLKDIEMEDIGFISVYHFYKVLN